MRLIRCTCKSLRCLGIEQWNFCANDNNNDITRPITLPLAYAHRVIIVRYGCNYDTHYFLQEAVNTTESHGVFVTVTAGIDIVHREATWEFQALDPETGKVLI